MLYQRDKLEYLSLKFVLCLVAFTFAFAVTLLVIWLTSAATSTGSTPASAISLTNHINTGVLSPDQQRWFRISGRPQSPVTRLERSISLIFTPSNLNESVSLKIFKANQVKAFEQIPAQVEPFGLGQWHSDAGSERSGFFWNGVLASDETYYIQIVNSSAVPVDYWLLSEGVEEEAPAQEIVEVVKPAPPLDTGQDSFSAKTLWSGLERGQLPPRTRHWYKFTRNEGDPDSIFQDLSFSLFFTPDDGHRRHQVNFQLFTAREVEGWQQGRVANLTNFGAGMLLSRDNDPNTGERIWRGSVIRNDTYFLMVENGTEVKIDYWLFDEDIINPQLGVK